MPPKPPADPLNKVLGVVNSWAAESVTKIIEGFLEENGALPVVVWNEEGDSSLEHFLSTLKEFRAGLVFLNITRLTRETWQGEIEELDESDEEDAVERRDALRECEAYIGHIAAMEIRAILASPAVILKYDASAPWFDLVYSQENESEDDLAQEQEENVKAREEADRMIDGFAKRLALDPAFQRAKNDSIRAYAARQLFQNDPEWHPSNQYFIVSQAKVIFESDIKPKLENEMIEKVRQLSAQGQSSSQIATALQITVSKVKSLLD